MNFIRSGSRTSVALIVALATSSFACSRREAARTRMSPGASAPPPVESGSPSRGAARPRLEAEPVAPFVVAQDRVLSGDLEPGPSTATVAALAEDDGTLYAVPTLRVKARSNAVFRSDDDGAHFRRGSAELPHGDPEGNRPSSGGTEISYAPITALGARAGLLLAGTRDGRIYRSTDRADSWSETNGLPAPVRDDGSGAVKSFVVGEGLSHALVGQRLFASSDRGASWRNDAQQLGSLSGEGTLLCGTVAGRLLVSADDGAHFRVALLEEVSDVLVRRGVVYAAAKDRVYASHDRGSTFHALPPPWSNGAREPLALFGLGLPPPTSLKQRTFAYALSTTKASLRTKNGAIVLSTPEGLVFTRDGGASYARSSAGLTTEPVVRIAAPDSELLAAGPGGALFASPEGSSDFRRNPYGGVNLRALVSSGTEVLAGDEQGRVFHSSNAGRDWSQVAIPASTPDGPVEAIAFHGPNRFIVRGGLLLSRDGGEHYADLRNGFPLTARLSPGGDSDYGVGCAEVSEHAALVCSSTGLLRYDGTGAWTAVNPGDQVGLVKALAVEQGRVFAATSSALYRSGDDGKTFIAVGRPASGLVISGMGAAAGELLVTATPYSEASGVTSRILLSSDFGETWVEGTPSAPLAPHSLPARGNHGWYVGLESPGLWHVVPPSAR